MVNESMAMTRQEILLNLKKNGKDNVLQTIDNCIFVLEHDENLRGTIRFNVLTERDCIVGDVGWERTGSTITERDMSYLKGFGKQRKCFLFPVRNAPTSDEAKSESNSQYWKGLHRLTNWFVNRCIRRVNL